MARSIRDLQLTSLVSGIENSSAADSGDLEDVRLLDSYDKSDCSYESELEQGIKRIQVRVTGMTCAACSNSVEAALKAVDGVLSASVALLQNKADVVFNSSLVKVTIFFRGSGFLWHQFLINCLIWTDKCRLDFILRFGSFHGLSVNNLSYSCSSFVCFLYLVMCLDDIFYYLYLFLSYANQIHTFSLIMNI